MSNAQVEQVLFTGTGGAQHSSTGINIGVVKLDPPQLAPTRNLPQHGSHCSCVQVTLKQEYLLNIIELEGIHSQPLDSMCSLPNTDEVPMINTTSLPVSQLGVVSHHFGFVNNIIQAWMESI